MDLFRTLKTILTAQPASAEDVKSINSYVMCRWLSGSPQTIFVAEQLNLNYNIPVELQYKFAQHLLKHKVKYLRYYSNSTRSTDDITNIQNYYNISAEKAAEYSKLISEEELEYINSQMKPGKSK